MSENAKNAAKEVIKRIDNGEKIVMGEILDSLGYAETVVKNPQEVTKGQAYKGVMETFATRLEKEILRIQIAMEKKDLDKEQYRVLSDSLDKLNKNLQLATGGATERTEVSITEEQFNNILNSYANRKRKNSDNQEDI